MEELARALQKFNELVERATAAHQLKPGTFDWLSGETRQPMEPQPILAPGDIMASPWYLEAVDHDSFASHLTVYGGRIANREGNFQYGHVNGSIAEPTPPGTKHQSNRHDPPIPFIVRMLTIKEGVVTVRTPEKDRPEGQGPVVFEGVNDYGRWATVTCYDPRSDELTVRSGDYVTDGHGWGYDQTVAEDARQLEQGIVEARVAIMVYTLDGASDILDKVASRDHAQATWEISRSYMPPVGW